jgi:hypothetical protein
MRYRLRTLLIVLALGPPVLSVAWWCSSSDSAKPLLYSPSDVREIERRLAALHSNGMLKDRSWKLDDVLTYLGIADDPPPRSGREWGNGANEEWLPLSETKRLVVYWSVPAEGITSDGFVRHAFVEDVTKPPEPITAIEFEAWLRKLFSERELQQRRVQRGSP